MNLGQIVQSHALSFFHLSGPDLLLGWDGDPAKRNVFGLIAADPELARAGIRLRQFGQEIIESAGRQARSTPPGPCPAASATPLTDEQRDDLRGRAARGAGAPSLAALGTLQEHARRRTRRRSTTFGNFPSLFLGLVTPDGDWEHYDGLLRFVDATGKIVADQLDPAATPSSSARRSRPDSYLKSPYYRPLGYPEGVYRVGPLARLNICDAHGHAAGRRANWPSSASAAAGVVNCVVLSTTTPG